MVLSIKLFKFLIPSTCDVSVEFFTMVVSGRGLHEDEPSADEEELVNVILSGWRNFVTSFWLLIV